MEIRDTRKDLRTFLLEELPLKITISVPHSEIGDYDRFGDPQQAVRVRGVFGRSRTRLPGVCEVIRNRILNIPDHVWDAWQERLIATIKKFEEQTGQTIILQRTKTFIVFGGW